MSRRAPGSRPGGGRRRPVGAGPLTHKGTDFLTSSFADLRLAEPLLRALAAQNHLRPTPIQAQAIPPLLAGRDVLGVAQTGTGKTAAFALPILHRLAQHPQDGRTPRALVLTPTRELAAQIGDSFRLYGRHLRPRSAAVFGGVGQRPQVAALARGVDILIATPGRLLDLHAQGHVRFERLLVLVLDEADRMLDMGFLPDIRRILALLPEPRQNLLFSATMPEAIARLAAGLLKSPVRIEIAPPATVAAGIDQHVIFVADARKLPLLAALLRAPEVARALVFARTKRGADRLAARLADSGLEAQALHGNKSQAARHRALDGFRRGQVRVLVATDLAARGLDVAGISHVINFDLPSEPEGYVHRIGRTARAGAGGVAISLCAAAERGALADIERLTRQRLRIVDHPEAAARPGADPAGRGAGPPGEPSAEARARRRGPRKEMPARRAQS
jgi:ATP-dependent RNA helicase RhlE